MKSAVFLATLGIELALIGAVGLSLLFPRLRFWPPPSRRSWQYQAIGVLTGLFLPCFILLGVLDWDSLSLRHWIRYPLGSGLIIAGAGLTVWSVRALGLKATLGAAGQLVRRGPYRYSRNPQYVGNFLWLAGSVVLSSSALILIAALLDALLCVLAPFAEEPWLRQIYATDYEAYAREAPRFWFSFRAHRRPGAL